MLEPTALAQLEQHLPASPHLADNPAAVYLASLAPRSQRVQAGALTTVADFLGKDVQAVPWHQLHYQHMQAIRTQLAERYAPATANRILAALRGVLKEAWRLGLMDAETYHMAIDVQAVRGSTLPRGRGLSQGEFRALFAVCSDDTGPAGVRDAALLATLYAGGLRRSEDRVTMLDEDVHAREICRVQQVYNSCDRLPRAASVGRFLVSGVGPPDHRWKRRRRRNCRVGRWRGGRPGPPSSASSAFRPGS